MNNKVTFILVISIGMILAFLTAGETFYNTWIFLLIILAINYFIVRKNIKKIDSNFVINKETHIVFEEVKFKYILVNKSIVPIYKAKVNLILSKEFGSITSEVENISFKANQIIELKRSFICEKRGYYEIGKLEAEVRDLFSFFTKKKMLDKSINIKVYPKVVDISKFESRLNGFLGNVKSNRRSIDDFTNIKSNREYVIGDSPKNINFKLSARGEKTYIKEYYDSTYLDLVIVVDAFFNEDDRNISEELCISVSLSIAKYILESNGQLQYMLSDKSNTNLKLNNLSDFSTLLENVVTRTFNGEKSLNHYLGNILRNIRKTSDFIVITRHIDEDLVGKLISMQNRGSNIILYIVDDRKENNSVDGPIKSMTMKLESNEIRIYLIKELDQL